MLRFKGTLFERLGAHGARVEAAFDVPWTYAGVAEVFPAAVETAKERVQLWAAAKYAEGANRGNAGLLANHAAVLDKDCGDIGEFDAVLAFLRARGQAYIAYTSWSHRDPNKTHETGARGPFDSFRLILPYSEDLSPQQHTCVVQALFGHEVPADPKHYTTEAAGRFVALANGTERAMRPRGWDPCATRPAQGWFVPAAPPERESLIELDVFAGRPLDVGAILARPTTAVPSMRTARPYRPPTQAASGAMGVLERELQRRGFWLSAPAYTGWRRSVCPHCHPEGVQTSPSLTARPNGDGLDLYCHVGCRRADILGALGLTGEGAFAPPSELRIRLDEQLERQAPRAPAISVGDAVLKLEQDLRDGLEQQDGVVLKYPAGTGKSRSSAKVIAEHVAAGRRVCYSTQAHQVAHETRMNLPAEVRARSVHLHSPLVQVGDEPVCERREELWERVFEFGDSLLGSICPKCPKREDCAAHAQATANYQNLDDADVVFVSHAGIRSVFGVDHEGNVRGLDRHLIVDEMPGTYVQLSVSAEHLKALADGAMLSAAKWVVARVVQELAAAYRERRAPGHIHWQLGDLDLGSARDLAVGWGRLRLREGAAVRADEAELLRAADSLIRLVCHEAAGGSLKGVEAPERLGLAAMVPDACHEALVGRRGVLLSATPMLAALPTFRVRSVEVQDGARVRRVMVLRGHRGSGAVLGSFYDDAQGARVRASCPGFIGVPWPAVDEALARALREADRYAPDARVLFVTFKALADKLRAQPWRLAGGRVEVGHYGALRGLNDWQEGAERECRVVYCFGTPRFAVAETLHELGLAGEAADQAWIAYAAGELAQAEGRLRLPRRTTPCSVMIEGDVAPLDWHAENVDEILEPSTESTPSGTLEAALALRTREELEAYLGERLLGDPGELPVESPKLSSAAEPDILEFFALTARCSAARWKNLTLPG